MTSISSHSSVAKLGSRIVWTQSFDMSYGDIKLGLISLKEAQSALPL